ncbi:MAG: methylenetetrahydrofolate--tRNA-(uracil(54)-C(5))-methyltransferase (FADH(2)-oxidizing) TrmFO [Clostridia bacterium]|nr:methylenetetrahydrofolate--tRNA-(uracil(54)-C(5))-methyltransferase (FADH(2)-oxidizing) TrmFO [Clostridia bacterium]
MADQFINIIGAGLAGSEAAWQVAQRGIKVKLYEMRPHKMPPSHKTAYFGELVCSNSLRAAGLGNAVGLLKEEMRLFDSLIMQAADASKVPAGGALAVDREAFGSYITKALSNHPNIQIIHEEITDLSQFSGIVIIAAGPLASEKLTQAIAAQINSPYLHFHDAVAPIVDGNTINMQIAFRASRCGRGDLPEGDYINCPMNKEEYLAFYNELVSAELVPLKVFEKEKDFQGCMPIEAMARRGVDTMRFGPLKPVGIINPHTGTEAYAIVQLRQDNASATMFNMVGFQTRLTWPEQKRVFRMIPGLEKAGILRYGVMHRNTYLNSPMLLNADLSLKAKPQICFAGQITGVEGYVESAACGMVVGINAARKEQGKTALLYPSTTALGGLIRYLQIPNPNFQPMNVTFGLLEPLGQRIRKKSEKNRLLAERALTDIKNFLLHEQV